MLLKAILLVPSPKSTERRILMLALNCRGGLPSCMISQQFGCQGCEVGEGDSCILLQEPELLSLLRWRIVNLPRLIEDDVSYDLVLALVEVFESQGSALHIEKAYSLLLRERPDLEIDLQQLKRTLSSNSQLFRQTDTNVFDLVTDM